MIRTMGRWEADRRRPAAAGILIAWGPVLLLVSLLVSLLDVAPAYAVSPPEAAAGGPYAATVGETIILDGTASSDPEGGALTYLWELGDGTTADGPTPTHAYTAHGTYTVTLTVTDEENLTDSASTMAFVNAAPVAAAGGPYAATLGESIAFDGSGSFDPDLDSLTYLWEFGDGTTAGGATPSHTYTTGGTFVVTLTVSDPGGLSDGDVTEAVVNAAPVAAAGGPYAATLGESIGFDGSGSFDPDLDPLTYLWEFGDGTTADGATPSHTYTTGGTFVVTLTVSDPGGLSDGDVTEAVVNAAPVAAAGGPYAANLGESIS
ncbi:MAG: PKD domain-containing protein, partial [Candidatus Eiseniibacteriota bacterium]